MRGARGNPLLTSLTGAVLLMLLAVGSTGYRFLRYYSRNEDHLPLGTRGYLVAAGVVTTVAAYSLADPSFHGSVR